MLLLELLVAGLTFHQLSPYLKHPLWRGGVSLVVGFILLPSLLVALQESFSQLFAIIFQLPLLFLVIFLVIAGLSFLAGLYFASRRNPF